MRPPFNSFRPQAHPHRPQQQQQQQQNNGYSNHHQHNGYQNPMQANQLRMMNPQMMGNPMMGLMNNPNSMPNMPVPPQFVNNLSNMPQQQLQQQLQQFALTNHINHLLPNLLGNLQFAVANNNLMGQSLPLVQPNFFQPQLNSFNARPYPPVPNPHQNHQLRPPGFSDPRPQGQSVGIINNANASGSKGNDFRNKFTKHQKFKGPGQGFQRSQFHKADNGKRNYGFNKDQRGKGNYNKTKTGLDGSDADNIAEKKRSFALVYTPKEIQQWRDARRKNFPTKLYVEKARKVKKNVSDSILDKEAKMRRKQLREVLAKQAELGVEVAEIPSHYISDTDGQVNGDRGNNNGKLHYKVGQKGRFQNNRHNKRRNDGKDKSAKKTRFEDENSSKESSITRKPTLLEKLLSADIKRDKSQLLQVFRCMVMNSFFKEFPEQPLKLPLVMVEETGCENGREDPLAEVLCDDLSDDDVDEDDEKVDVGVGVDDDDNDDDGVDDDVGVDDDDVDVDVNGDDNSCDEDVD